AVSPTIAESILGYPVEAGTTDVRYTETTRRRSPGAATVTRRKAESTSGLPGSVWMLALRRAAD
ncbi:MAG: hypothetical protein O2788_04705, partial [Chloroflexi bacterium]|nr:hypothetical protein [Chloroflexota bacterium]